MGSCGSFLALGSILVVLTACASTGKRTYLVLQLPAEINVDTKKVLSEKEVLEDLDQLKFALKSGSAEQELIPQDQVKALEERLRKIRGVRLLVNLCDELGDAFHDYPDSQIRFQFHLKTCGSQPLPPHGSVGDNQIGAQSPPLPLWAVRIEKHNGHSALLIAVRKLPPRQSKDWKGFLEAVAKQLPMAQLIVIDLRGVSGGDEAIGYELSYRLAGTRLKSSYSSRWSNESPEAQQLRLNGAELQLQNWVHKHRRRKPPQALTDLKTELTAKVQAAVHEKITFLAAPWNDGQENFDSSKSAKKPIYILIDSACSGGCEHVVDAFEFNPLAKTVGEKTAGDVTFGKPGVLNLKNSGIWVQIPTSANKYADDRWIEKRGIMPKVPVLPKLDAWFEVWHLVETGR